MVRAVVGEEGLGKGIWGLRERCLERGLEVLRYYYICYKKGVDVRAVVGRSFCLID